MSQHRYPCLSTDTTQLRLEDIPTARNMKYVTIPPPHIVPSLVLFVCLFLFQIYVVDISSAFARLVLANEYPEKSTQLLSPPLSSRLSPPLVSFFDGSFHLPPHSDPCLFFFLSIEQRNSTPRRRTTTTRW